MITVATPKGHVKRNNFSSIAINNDDVEMVTLTKRNLMKK